MDPHLRWLRRLVIARVAERVAIEASLVGLIVGVGLTAAGVAPYDVGVGAVAAAGLFGPLRVGLALSTNPVDHRYLLRWTDPTARLIIVEPPGPGSSSNHPSGPGSDTGSELGTDGFNYLGRLRRTDATDDQAEAEIDLYGADGGRLIVGRSGDGELTVLSRLDDGRSLVTAPSLIPPTERLLVQRVGGGDGGASATTDALIDHVERLLALRSEGIEAVTTVTADLVDLLRTEWEAWQELGPFVGPLLAIGAEDAAGLTSRLGLRLLVHLPDDLLRDRTNGRSHSFMYSKSTGF